MQISSSPSCVIYKMFLITHFAADYTPVTVNINILLFFGIFTALPNSFKLKFLHYILEYALNKLK